MHVIKLKELFNPNIEMKFAFVKLSNYQNKSTRVHVTQKLNEQPK